MVKELIHSLLMAKTTLVYKNEKTKYKKQTNQMNSKKKERKKEPYSGKRCVSSKKIKVVMQTCKMKYDLITLKEK